MNINREDNFNEAIDFLILRQSIDTFDLDARMSSTDANNQFEFIEFKLNQLYEKTRVLEDVMEYASAFLMTEIENKKTIILNKAKLIERNYDSMINNKFITTSVDFLCNISLCKDRNGKTLPILNASVNSLTSSVIDKEIANIYHVAKTSNAIGYKDNLVNFISGEPYRSFYALDEVFPGGVTEDIVVEFYKSTEFNHVDINTSNCVVVSIKNVDSGQIISTSAGHIPKQSLKKICITVKAAKYNEESNMVDANALGDDFMICAGSTIVSSDNIDSYYSEDNKKLLQRVQQNCDDFFNTLNSLAEKEG